MRILIHRGTQEIGGTCIQLMTENSTILLDLGLPLKKDSKSLNLSNIRKDAVLISHSHADHFGLIEGLDDTVPVYIGEVARRLIDATRIILRKNLYKNNFQYFKPWKSFNIGDFVITPYPVDHSATDAYAFLISAEGKRIFYSGDFRGHGRKAIFYEKIIENPPKNIDVLFMEGSMIGRDNAEFPTEESVETKILEIIQTQNNISFLICSSQNIDRIVSAFKACKRAGKTLVIDFYTAWVLEQLKLVTMNVPAMDWKNVKVFADFNQDRKVKSHPEYFGEFRQSVYNKYRVRNEALHTNPERYVCVSKVSRFKTIDSFKKKKPVNVIYSQWRGYIDNPEFKSFGSDKIAAYRNDPKINFTYAHTSGHAPVEDLRRFAEALKPTNLIPVHTENALTYPSYFNNIRLINDGEMYSL